MPATHSEPLRPSQRGASRPARLLVDLALAGGGSHGAFTWGALDRLLEEDWIEVDGVSGTSAGRHECGCFRLRHDGGRT